MALDQILDLLLLIFQVQLDLVGLVHHFLGEGLAPGGLRRERRASVGPALQPRSQQLPDLVHARHDASPLLLDDNTFELHINLVQDLHPRPPRIDVLPYQRLPQHDALRVGHDHSL